ncbi:MAG: formylglycine-generating enzyme family protein [Deltaproteobacteria bacterium]|nr:formylglycine-generating enzyme family protein [Deltaproteobacteria bacterium]MCB9788589.1 formylglycine-generating enzyme family protein [Deltaproteobacteria bacterium]
MALLLTACGGATEGAADAGSNRDSETDGVALSNGDSADPTRPCGLLGVPCPADFKCTRLPIQYWANDIWEFCYRASDNAVYVPAGTFIQGCAVAEYEDGAYCQFVVSKKPRAVTTPEYLIQRTPVTVGQYQQCADDDPASCPPFPTPPPEVLAETPYWHDVAVGQMTRISEEGARSYCQWLATQSETRWRLCSESEWEKAARGDCRTLDAEGDLDLCAQRIRTWPWGEGQPTCAYAPNVQDCEYYRDNYAYAMPVGLIDTAASAYGVLDTWGGFPELVADCVPDNEFDTPGYPPTDGSAWLEDCAMNSGVDPPHPIGIARSGGYRNEYSNTIPLSHLRATYPGYAVEQFRCCAEFTR